MKRSGMTTQMITPGEGNEMNWDEWKRTQICYISIISTSISFQIFIIIYLCNSYIIKKMK